MTAGFLAADDDGFALHEGPDVFEADGGFVDFHAEECGDGINLMAGGHGADDRTGPAAVLFQVVKRQGEDLGTGVRLTVNGSRG